MPTLESLLSDAPPLMGKDWLPGLEERKREEAEFHDTERGERTEEAGNAHWYHAARPVAEHIERWISENVPGKVVLDYACGSGPVSLRLARAGASLVVGIDISRVSVEMAASNAVGLSNVRFLQRDCEDTGLPSSSFDLILCSGMLHHLDLTKAFPELYRLLKPGGRVLCVEALNYNPLIRLYRLLTPQHRTAWEAKHILSMKDVRFARQWFQVEHMEFFCMVSPLATLTRSDTALRIGHAIDALLTRVPLLRLWSWQFAFELVRR